MSYVKQSNRRAFTLIELLVVVAIIALLISILLPSLQSAREKARAAKCGVMLKQLGTGLETYYTENDDWIPGVNTTGIALRAGADINTLRKPYVPTQTFDWISPFMRYETELGNNRALRMKTLINEFACPSVQNDKVDSLWALEDSLDKDDFKQNGQTLEFAPLSFLMPAHFQWWGQGYSGRVIATGTTASGRPINISAVTANPNFAAVHPGSYVSRRSQVGPASRKIAAADGLRYLTDDGRIDFDVSPNPSWFGAFCSNGAWWGGSEEYGVDPATSNWDGSPVNTGVNPESKGRALAWSYRHHSSAGRPLTDGVRSNNGEMNALFFDGHVARMGDRQSRNIEFWYPTGTIAQPNSGGLTDVPQDYRVP